MLALCELLNTLCVHDTGCSMGAVGSSKRAEGSSGNSSGMSNVASCLVRVYRGAPAPEEGTQRLVQPLGMCATVSQLGP
jgi:hypothetical protein